MRSKRKKQHLRAVKFSNLRLVYFPNLHKNDLFKMVFNKDVITPRIVEKPVGPDGEDLLKYFHNELIEVDKRLIETFNKIKL